MVACTAADHGLPADCSPVPSCLRWVLIRDSQGAFDPQALLCTRQDATPAAILAWFVQRWQREVTLEACCAHTPAERTALAPYTAAVPLYAAALDGFTEDPAGKLRTRLPFLRLSEWLLAHPEATVG